MTYCIPKYTADSNVELGLDKATFDFIFDIMIGQNP